MTKEMQHMRTLNNYENFKNSAKIQQFSYNFTYNLTYLSLIVCRSFFKCFNAHMQSLELRVQPRNATAAKVNWLFPA